MRPFKVRVISNHTKKLKTDVPSNSPTTVGVSSERYIDYTNFQDGSIMTYDEERNRYYFVTSDEVISNTFQQENPPEVFSNEITNEIDERVDIDFGEY